jgi:hypothetical protein
MNITTEELTSRFRDAAWYDSYQIPNTYVTIGGVGGIGSWLSMFLSRIGLNLNVYDFDRVEPHNLGGQLFLQDSLYKHKEVAIKELIERTCPKPPVIRQHGKFIQGCIVNNLTIACFDNMIARNYMFSEWVRTTNQMIEIDNESLYIDGRCTLEQIQIYCVKNTLEDIQKYRECLLTDDEIPEAQCSIKQTSHVAAMIAAHITGFLTNHLANVFEHSTVREIPFYYEYFLPQNLTVTS